jgi:putative Mn2+ efflux pump MntP
MDAFSLALVYGIIGINKKQRIILSLIVGIYHFIMPLIGLTFGIMIDNISFINLHIIASIILMYIGTDLIISKKEDESLSINLLGFIIFGFSVSLDSLTVGIGLKAITNNYFLSSVIFSISSLIFTYIGLLLGNMIGKKIGTYAKIIGGIVLIIISIIMIIK